ncbi:MAG: PH domain-containing protein [Acidobacteria bacterium]|nr:PH domain-containing protein [Acidobacteriota bacterium]
MFCTKCGVENKDTAGFCRNCGTSIEEQETRVAARGGPPDRFERPTGNQADSRPLDDNEREIFSISPTLLFVKIGYVLAAVAALFLVAITSAFVAAYVPIWLAVGVGLLLFLIPLYYHIKQRLVRYTLTESKLEIDRGLIARTTRNLPIGRIQDVTVSTNILQRLLGFGDVVVDNANDEAGKAVLKNINSPREYADKLLRQMREQRD